MFSILSQWNAALASMFSGPWGAGPPLTAPPWQCTFGAAFRYWEGGQFPKDWRTHGIEKESKEVRGIQGPPEKSEARLYQDPLREGAFQRLRRVAGVRQIRVTHVADG